MSELENSSLKEKSGGKSDTSLSASVESEWRERSQVGTACKCGAHANIPWPEGGAAWLAAHVAEAHPTAFDWPGAVRHALELGADDPDAAFGFLSALVKDEGSN